MCVYPDTKKNKYKYSGAIIHHALSGLQVDSGLLRTIEQPYQGPLYSTRKPHFVSLSSLFFLLLPSQFVGQRIILIYSRSPQQTFLCCLVNFFKCIFLDYLFPHAEVIYGRTFLPQAMSLHCIVEECVAMHCTVEECVALQCTLEECVALK